jgi:LmbE family N-acetylglucosaminyl deacetylase
VSCARDFAVLVEQRSPSVLVVAAHPDDETLGAGALLGELREVRVLFATDGAPADGGDARAAGFVTVADYARARAAEADAALAVAGVPAGRADWLGFGDQRLAQALAPAARQIAARLAREPPDVLLTHAYEGGHPDHDAAAFAARAALALCPGALLVEVGLYHARDGCVRRLELLPGPPGAAVSCQLTPGEQARKRAMCACYVTQRAVLAAFPGDVERYRRASPTRFTAPPHPGPLHYEGWASGMTGARFRAQAADALVALGLEDGI